MEKDDEIREIIGDEISTILKLNVEQSSVSTETNAKEDSMVENYILERNKKLYRALQKFLYPKDDATKDGTPNTLSHILEKHIAEKCGKNETPDKMAGGNQNEKRTQLVYSNGGNPPSYTSVDMKNKIQDTTFSIVEYFYEMCTLIIDILPKVDDTTITQQTPEINKKLDPAPADDLYNILYSFMENINIEIIELILWMDNNNNIQDNKTDPILYDLIKLYSNIMSLIVFYVIMKPPPPPSSVFSFGKQTTPNDLSSRPDAFIDNFTANTNSANTNSQKYTEYTQWNNNVVELSKHYTESYKSRIPSIGTILIEGTALAYINHERLVLAYVSNRILYKLHELYTTIRPEPNELQMVKLVSTFFAALQYFCRYTIQNHDSRQNQTPYLYPTIYEDTSGWLKHNYMKQIVKDINTAGDNTELNRITSISSSPSDKITDQLYDYNLSKEVLLNIHKFWSPYSAKFIGQPFNFSLFRLSQEKQEVAYVDISQYPLQGRIRITPYSKSPRSLTPSGGNLSGKHKRTTQKTNTAHSKNRSNRRIRNIPVCQKTRKQCKRATRNGRRQTCKYHK